ncbi:VanW family protein [Candidatus Cryosericum terrychapinii]|jgi:vancomycin resistance protein VanW|uniref:Vancomycin resistance protein n=1 Tax=Candidatus Cryosericum terrychapinii TaxID=2290919 RepID=A0A398CWX7_9BACT|nr:VanW family protein [Candidatus Cryosericum terrychapinii]RIE05759.1 vancomycin resistance protein [Candidatus Cryosericum terrychapinii]
MGRKLFCEISPTTYEISVFKNILVRDVKNIFSSQEFATSKMDALLPVLIYRNKSLMRRVLGNVDPLLQENKVQNLGLSAPKVTNVLIRPGQIFSFWKLAGRCSKKEGYRKGLVISSGKVSEGIGGGMCQFTNLIHFIVLHSPMDIVEHHHHDGMDLFPDFGRQIPFGTGTSIMYNYLDYRFKNSTDTTFQLITYVTDKYLCGELRANKPLDARYHIRTENEYFSREGDTVYRNGLVFREQIDEKTGNLLLKELIKKNHAMVMYDIDDKKIVHDAK